MAQELSDLARGFQPGVYRHYKGKDYACLHIVRHSETEEQLVWYQPLYDGLGQRIRPLTRPDPREGGFLDDAENGRKRFVLLNKRVPDLPRITEEPASIYSSSLKYGPYRHFKGGLMMVVGLAVHTEIPAEQGNEFVIYRHEGEEPTLWARPVKSFFEFVEINGQRVLRFEWLGG
jgi:hypothetical protein